MNQQNLASFALFVVSEIGNEKKCSHGSQQQEIYIYKGFKTADISLHTHFHIAFPTDCLPDVLELKFQVNLYMHHFIPFQVKQCYAENKMGIRNSKSIKLGA